MPNNDWDGKDRRNTQRWRIKREISVGDIVAFCTAAIAVVFAYTTLDKRITLLESSIVVQQAVDTRQDLESQRYRDRFDEAMREINRKLDRLIENRTRP